MHEKEPGENFDYDAIQAERIANQIGKKIPGLKTIAVEVYKEPLAVYGGEDIENCDNQCEKCRVFQVLNNYGKDKKSDVYFGLKPASKDLKKFGPRNQFNCKSYDDHIDAFVIFLTSGVNKETIEDEIESLSQVRFIYTRDDCPIELAENFKKAVIERALPKFKEGILSVSADDLLEYSKKYGIIR